MSKKMKTPEQIADEVINELRFSTNRMLDGRLVGEQHFAALAIAEAIRRERKRYDTIKQALCTGLMTLSGVRHGRLKPTGKRVNAAFTNVMSALDQAEQS